MSGEKGRNYFKVSVYQVYVLKAPKIEYTRRFYRNYYMNTADKLFLFT